MKAWVLEDVCKLVLRDMAELIPDSHEVLIKISSFGLCGSDVEIYKGHRVPEIAANPLILGHEACGVVEECGQKVREFKPGDHVVLRGIWGCCAEYVKASVFSPPSVNSLRCVQLIKIPAEMANIGVSLLEVLPKIIKSVDRAGISTATDVLVLGQGVTGLLLTQVVNLKSPHHLVAVDLFENKLKIAQSYGATHAVIWHDPASIKDIRAILPDGADVVFPCHLDGSGVADAIELLKWGGKIILWGCLGKGKVDFFRLHARGGDILSARMDDLAEDAEYCRRAVDYVQRGIIDPGDLITNIFEFNQMPEAFRLKEGPRGDVIHTVVKL